MKRIILIALLCATPAFSQLNDFFTGATPVSHLAILGSPTATTSARAILESHAVVTDSILAYLVSLGYTPGIFDSLQGALAAARSTPFSPLIIPYGTPGTLSLAAQDSNLFVVDWRFGKLSNYGIRRWGFSSVVEADSLNRLQKIIDSTRTYGVIHLGRGTWTVASPVQIFNNGLRISGTVAARARDDATNLIGSTILTTSTTSRDTFGILEAGFQGVDISNLILRGNDQNSNGFYGHRGDTVVTTLGGYKIHDVLAIDNGKAGFNFEGSDGGFYYNLESYGNVGNGLKVTNPEGNGKVTSSSARGTTNVFISGRHRRNGLGILSKSSAATTYIGVESITDTTYNFRSDSTRATVNISPDYEFVAPPRSFAGAQPRAINVMSTADRGYTWLGGYMGSILTHQSVDDTTDSGTNTTTVVDATLNVMPNDYYVGYEFTNTSLDSPAVEVTDYVASTNTLTLGTAIPGQTLGQGYSLTRKADVGFLGTNLASSVFINTTFPENADTVWAADGTYSNAIFINPIQFNPETDIKTRSGAAATSWFWWDMDNFSDSVACNMTNKFQWNLRTISDSLVFKSDSSSVRMEAYKGLIDLQPAATSDSASNGDVDWNRSVSNNIRPQFKLWFDADTSSSTSRKNIRFNGASGSPNRMTFSGSDSLVSLGMAMPFELTGTNGEARFMDILATTGGAPPTTIPLGTDRIRLYMRSDSLWAYNDNALDFNLMRGGAGSTTLDGLTDVNVTGAAGGNVLMLRADNVTWVDSTVSGSGDITSVTAGNGIVGGATSGDAPVAVDTTDTFRWSGIHYHIADSDSLIHDLSTSLYPVDLHVNASRVFAVDSAGNTLTASVTEGANAVPNATDHLGFFSATTSAQLAGVLSNETGTGLSVFGTSPEITTSVNVVADGDTLKLNQAAVLNPIDLETNNTTVFSVDSTGIATAVSLLEGANAVPNATDHLGFFAATTSAQLAGVLSNETGTGLAVFATSPEITTSANVVADGDTLKLNQGVVLNPIDLETNNTSVFTVDSTGIATAVSLLEGANAVPNATDHLGFFAATTSAQLAGVLSNETGSGLAVFATSPEITTSTSVVSDGDTLKLNQNTALNPIDLETNNTSVFTVDSTGIATAVSLLEGANAVPNATDHLGFFAATTSAQLAGVLSNETGSGLAVFGTSPEITTSVNVVSDGDTLKFNQNVALNSIDLETNNTTVFAVDTSGNTDAAGTLTSGSGNIAITNVTGNLDGTKVADADLGDISVSSGSWTIDANTTAQIGDTSYVEIPFSTFDTTATPGSVTFEETGKSGRWTFAASTIDTLILRDPLSLPKHWAAWVAWSFTYNAEQTGADTLVVMTSPIAHDEPDDDTDLSYTHRDTLVSATGPAANDSRESTLLRVFNGTFVADDKVWIAIERLATDAGVMNMTGSLKLYYRRTR